jgi:predicted metal-dependent peptidase
MTDIIIPASNTNASFSGGSITLNDMAEGYAIGRHYADMSGLGTGGIGPMFNHFFDDKFEELEKMETDEANLLINQAEAQIKETVIRAVQETIKSRGTIPSHLESLIESFTKSSVNWLAVLRNAVVNAIRTNRKRSMRRPNRRSFGIPNGFHFPGSVKDKSFEVAFLIDTSGSMGDEELSQAIGELEKLRKVNKGMKITIVEADITIHKEYKLELGQEVQRNMLGRGGTDFNLALARAKELNPGICFYFTDGYGGGVQIENRVKCPFYWIVTPSGTTPDAWGKCIFTKPGGANVRKNW